jgi:hypothetical protein
VPFVSSIMAQTLMFFKIWKLELTLLQQNRGHDDDLMEGEILEQIEQLQKYLTICEDYMLERRTTGRHFSPSPMTDLESLFLYNWNI